MALFCSHSAIASVTVFQVFDWGNRLNDSHFHSFKVKRRAEKIVFFLDGKSIQSCMLIIFFNEMLLVYIKWLF